MSGIAALYERNGAPAEKARASAMLHRLRHRGLDRSGLHVQGSIALAQCTLETTPEDALERQPYRASFADLWIVADARIDNREELLRLHGGDADRLPDSALILEAYRRWGEACPAKLIGDFAFVIWDGARRALFCARDHLGVRPLYYHHDACTFRCASEMQAIFADRRVERHPDRHNVALFVVLEYAEDGATLYEGVSVLPAGCSLTVTADRDGGGVHVRPYWTPDAPRPIRYATDEGYAEHFRQVFREAVRCRLRANGPVAGEVSGGLDSSSVVCEAEHLRKAGCVAGPPLMLERLAFPGLAADESPYSQAVADHLGLPIFTAYPLDNLDLCRPAPTLPDHYFEPTLRMSFPLLAETARRGIRVTLTGLGGDQLMRYTGHEAVHHLRRGRVWDAAIEAGVTETPLSANAWRRLCFDGLKALAPPAALRAFRRARRRFRPRQWPWLTPAMSEAASEHTALADRRAEALHADPIEGALRDDLAHALSTPYTLAINDRVLASFGQEARHPFLDVRVIEYLLAIPNEQRFYLGLPKPVLRRAMGGTLPALVRERRDKGEFTDYVRRAFWEPHARAVRELLRRSKLEEIGIVDGDEVRLALGASDPNVFRLAAVTAMELWLGQVTSPQHDGAASGPRAQAAGLPTEVSEEQHGCA